MGQTLTDSGDGRDFQILDAGTYIAICTAQVGIAWQETHYGEKEQIKVRFEVPGERVEWTDRDGVDHEGPMVVWKTYTASLNEKANLRKDLVGWRGRDFTEEELQGFDIGAIVGKPCQITVVHKKSGEKTYANVASVTGLPKGMKAPKPETDLIDFNPYDYQQKDFDALPEWLQERVTEGLELWEKQKQRVATSQKKFDKDMDDYRSDDDFTDDDIPF